MEPQRIFKLTKDVYDRANPERLLFKSEPGLSEELVRQISIDKGEPDWMLKKRLEAFKLFNEMKMPNFGPDISDLDFNEIHFYMKPDSVKNSRSWQKVPKEIRETYEKLGIPEAERKSLAGVGAQYESEVVYHNLQKEWENLGVVFLDCDEGLKKYPELFKKYFMTTCISPNLHKFTALHGAVWSGGTFIYVPKNVKVKMPLQAYFRMNARKGGQFEHTLIIADEGSEVHYIEGCFTKGNLVTSNPDYKKIENIKENDLVLTSEGEFKKVKNVQVRPYSGDIYTIEFYGDSSQKIEVIPEHQFLYVDRKSKNDRNKIFKPRWNISRFFKKGDYLVMPINQIVNHKDYGEFEVEYKGKKEKIKVPLIPDFFRLIGYYLAEGSTIKEHYLCFDFNSKERGYIDDVKSLLKDIFKVEPYEQPNKINNGVSVRVNSTKLARLFRQFGNRNYNKNIPAWTMHEINKNQADLIKGWFRGDGNYYSKKHASGYKEVFRINTTSEKLVRQGRDILLRLGIVSFINKRDRSKENRRTIYTLGITGEQMIKFSEIVGIKINNKLNDKNRASMFGINDKFAFFPIKKITKKIVEDIPVFNFSVENHETYTVAGLAVHNCSAPVYMENSLHAGCVEIHVLKNARVRYSSIENWSKNTYNLNTKRAVVNENGIMEWVNGNTGCLTEDSKIFTNSEGPIEIKNIKTGDKVYVWNENTNSIKTSKVKNKIFSGNKKVYRLTAGGRELEASSNHPFLTLIREKNNPRHKKGFFKFAWKPLEELGVGDLIGITKELPHEGKPYILPEIEIGKYIMSKNQYSDFKMNTSHLYNKDLKIPKETNEDFMWLMGLLLGDGHIDLKNNKINIATHEKEDYRDKLIKSLKDLFNYDVTEKKERYIIINSIVLCRLFNNIGFGGNADTKKIPQWVFTLPKSQILSFLAGYVDSDGHISNRSVYLTSINKKILENVKLLGTLVGLWGSKIFVRGKARDSKILGKKVKLKDSWRILFNGKNVRFLPLKCMAKKNKLDRLETKRSYVSAKGMNFRSKVNEEIGFARIGKIDQMGIKPTYDIEVEEYHNFIANGLIVHNSKVTMLYPCSVLAEKGAKTDYIGIAYANKGQHQDTGCKVYHLAPNTSSHVISKSICMNGGITAYRGLVKIKQGCKGSKSSVRCDGLMLDNESTATTLPSMDVRENDVNVSHEAVVGKIGEEQLFYLMSRGLSEKEATKMIVSGFIEPLIKELPMEYAVELTRLIELEIENSVV